MTIDYLALLKVEDEKDIPIPGTAKTAQSPDTDFLQFMQSGDSGEKVDYSRAVIGDRHFRWRIELPNRAPFEVRVLPESTADEMLTQYPGVGIEPMPERAGRVATNAESDELRALIRAILTDAPDEWDEVHRIACADPEAALPCWRSLAAALPPHGERNATHQTQTARD